ncbi:MAG: hypothetical protein FJ304_08210, partial [Planctomycetes bacterium]|nr:hypothetical protein [Planctomycetota bacterium]
MAAPKDDPDLDPVEPVEVVDDDAPPKKKDKRGADDGDAPAPKGKRDKGRAKDEDDPPPPKKKNKRAADDEDGDEPRRLKKVDGKAVPYPPQPENLPEGLADYPAAFKRQQKRLLAGLVLFLTLYIGAVLFFALFAFWCVWSFEHLFPIKVIGLAFSVLALVFLVKGFFKRPEGGRDGHVELTEDEHPVLFEFMRQLCDEVGAPEPNRLLVSADVNAMCIARTSLFSLFKEPKKDVLLGLGLVNAVNLSEFKAILAHELGHFSHVGNTSNYVHIMQRVIRDMVQGEDVLDRLVSACKSSESFKWLGYAIGGPLWLGRKVMFQAYKMIVRQELAVRREEEFHADLVAVSAAGSNASAHGLLRVRFAMQCFMQALRDLSVAMDHKLYTNDLYLHQDRAAPVVRRQKKEPTLGLPPVIAHPTDGQNIEVFDAEADEMEDGDDTPPMWRSHPCDADREKNAKRRFVPAVIDHRSPWLLFGNPADLRERLTYKFLRMVFKIPKNTELTDAVAVQKFIDNEHADTTYDPKYKGCYDDRPLEPGDISELNALVKEKPWDDDRMEKVLDKLYDGCEKHTETHAELYKELQALRANIVGRPSPKTKRKMEELEKEQDENWEWFKSFDRRVYLLHVQMAAQVDKDQKDELVERYRFQLEVQRLYQESRQAFNKADAYLDALGAAQRGQFTPGPDFIGEVLAVLRESWKALRNIIKDARDINLPAMKNFEEGENLASFILEGKMVPEPPLTYAKGVWIHKLMTQLQGVRQKCFRLHFKSVGGILAIQESVAAKWKALREPVSAEILEPEPVAAEILPSEPVAAEIIAAEVLPAEVVAAEVLPATVVAEVPPPPVVVAPPPAPPPAVV